MLLRGKYPKQQLKQGWTLVKQIQRMFNRVNILNINNIP